MTTATISACPVRVGDIFTSAEHGDLLIAHKVVQRKPQVWSIAAQAVDLGIPTGRPFILTDEPIRWTSVKVYAGRARVEVLGTLADWTV